MPSSVKKLQQSPGVAKLDNEGIRDQTYPSLDLQKFLGHEKTRICVKDEQWVEYSDCYEKTKLCLPSVTSPPRHCGERLLTKMADALGVSRQNFNPMESLECEVLSALQGCVKSQTCVRGDTALSVSASHTLSLASDVTSSGYGVISPKDDIVSDLSSIVNSRNASPQSSSDIGLARDGVISCTQVLASKNGIVSNKINNVTHTGAISSSTSNVLSAFSSSLGFRKNGVVPGKDIDLPDRSVEATSEETIASFTSNAAPEVSPVDTPATNPACSQILSNYRRMFGLPIRLAGMMAEGGIARVRDGIAEGRSVFLDIMMMWNEKLRGKCDDYQTASAISEDTEASGQSSQPKNTVDETMLELAKCSRGEIFIKNYSEKTNLTSASSGLDTGVIVLQGGNHCVHTGHEGDSSSFISCSVDRSAVEDATDDSKCNKWVTVLENDIACDGLDADCDELGQTLDAVSLAGTSSAESLPSIEPLPSMECLPGMECLPTMKCQPAVKCLPLILDDQTITLDHVDNHTFTLDQLPSSLSPVSARYDRESKHTADMNEKSRWCLSDEELSHSKQVISNVDEAECNVSANIETNLQSQIKDSKQTEFMPEQSKSRDHQRTFFVYSSSESSDQSDEDDDDWDSPTSSAVNPDDEEFSGLFVSGLYFPGLSGGGATSPTSPVRCGSLATDDLNAPTSDLGTAHSDDDDEIMFSEVVEEVKSSAEAQNERLREVNTRWRRWYHSGSSSSGGENDRWEGSGRERWGAGRQGRKAGTSCTAAKGKKSGKSVRFARAAAQRIPVLNEPEWAEEYERARVGPWITIALDRMRFDRRIQELDTEIGWIFNAIHRSRVCSARHRCC